MVLRFNPFQPQGMVPPGMFVGRVDELNSLEQCLFQTKNGSPSNFLIHGERGIGKSSLMRYMRSLATGQIPGLHQMRANHNFVTADIELQPESTFEDIIRKVASDFEKQLKKFQALKTFLEGALSFLKKLEVGGVRYHGAETTTGRLVEDLSDLFIGAMSELDVQVDGALILIDEADQAPASANLGAFLKVFTERLVKGSCNRVAIGVSGLSPVISKLKESHESSPRLLQHIRLETLLPDERKRVVRMGLDNARETSGQAVTIEPDALDWISKISEGYPHFVQQYAHSAFETDTDNNLTLQDVQFGAFKENGAIDQLGATYFQDMYQKQIGSDQYRKVLHVLSESPETFMSRQDILKKTGLKETALNNALSALSGKDIIVKDPERRGHYKLPSGSFAVWIRVRLARDAEKEAAKGDDLFSVFDRPNIPKTTTTTPPPERPQ